MSSSASLVRASLLMRSMVRTKKAYNGNATTLSFSSNRSIAVPLFATRQTDPTNTQQQRWYHPSYHDDSANSSSSSSSSRLPPITPRQDGPSILRQIVPPLCSWLPLHEWLSKDKIPRGFEDFFPEGSKAKSPGSASDEKKEGDTDVESDSSSSSGTAASEKNKPDGSERIFSSDSKDNKQKQSNDSPPPPPPLSEEPSLSSLLALLLAILVLRQWIEDGDGDRLGQEITFVDFRNQLLSTGKVEKIQVINKKMARVMLKPDAVGMMDTTTSATTTTTTGQDSSSSTSWATTNTTTTQAPSKEGWEGNSTEHTVPLSTSRGGTLSAGSSASSGSQQPHYYFYIGSVESFEEKLAKAQSHIHPAEWLEVHYVNRTNWRLELLKSLPFVAFVAAVYYGTRGMAGMPGAGSGRGAAGGRSIFSIGKSTAKKINKEDVNVSFKDVAGCQEAKREIVEFVDFLKDSDRFTKLGAKIPKGALLSGPPGTGKTLLAKAVAGEAGVPFYSISGSDFLEMFVGVGPSRVRDLFKEARANAPCIVFIDEIDAIGRQRGRSGFSGGNDERENTLNQLLVEMDGFAPTQGVVVLAGTNRVDILDPALTRPGRFDRQIQVDRPDLQGRKEIFEVHLLGIRLEGVIEEYAGRLAGLTPGFSGADIANICNEAAIVAARRKAEAVAVEDFEKATDRIIGGLESNKIMSAEERSIVAHHEAGHAIAGWFLEHADPLLKVTIIPRASGALGFAQYLPKEVFLRSKEQIMDIVCMALAGRAAEEVFFGRVTTGASDDLRRVTQLVYSTIKDFGMNSRLGQLSFPQNEASAPGDKPYSDSTAEAMDDEARSIVDAAYNRTVALIRERKDEVEKLAQFLLEKETITHDDITDLIGPRPFKGDSAYEQFVSHRAAKKNEKSDGDNEKDKKDSETESPLENESGVTPGLV